MKTGALVLALLVTTVQTVGWVECCCILICKHRNDPCSDCKEKKQEAADHHQADCCVKKDAAPTPPAQEKRCSHVEPSSEVVAQTAAVAPLIPDLVLELPVVPFQQAPADCHKTDATFCDIESRGSPPALHLLYSVLLI